MAKDSITASRSAQKDTPEDCAAAKPSVRRPGTWLKLRRLFGEAIQIGTEGRREWLEWQRANDSAVVREVAALLDHDDPDDRFLELPVWDRDSCPTRETGEENDANGLPPGTAIGSWQVVHKISSGGMGTVYLAERAVDEGQRSKQRAAIKVMRRRVDPEAEKDLQSYREKSPSSPDSTALAGQ